MNALFAAALLQLIPAQEDPGAWQYRTHGFQINTGPLLWNGFLIHPNAEFGFGMNIDQETDFESAGTNFRLDFEEKDFWTFGAGVEFDFGLLRLDVEGFYGGWRGTGRMIQSPDSSPIDTEAELDGTIFGLHVRLWYPLFVYHGQDVDVTFGPGIGFLWVRETLTDTHVGEDSGLTIQNDAVKETIDEKSFTIGFFFTYEVPIQTVKFVIELGVEYAVFGDLSGGLIGDILIGPKFDWTF